MKASLGLPLDLRLLHRYVYWRKAGVVFVHVPKAAGTAVNRAIYGRALGHYTVSELHEVFPRMMDRSFVFTVVRNPYERLASAYRFARLGRTRDMGIRNPAQYQIPEFNTFERFVNEWLVLRDLTQLDHVFRPQIHYVSIGGVVAVDMVCRLETLADDIGPVERRLGRKLELKFANSTGGARHTPMSDELKETIHALYREDFELLGYPK